MIINVESWLGDPAGSYQEGLTIYNTYKISNKHDRFFGAVNDATSSDLRFKMLVGELQRILHKLRGNPTLQKQIPGKSEAPVREESTSITCEPINLPPQVSKVRIVHDNDFKYDELPPHIRRHYDSNKSLAREKSMLHMKLRELPVSSDYNGKRSDILLEIGQLEAKINENWKKIDDYCAKKDVPVDPEVLEAKRYLGSNHKSVNPQTQAKCQIYKERLAAKGINWSPGK